VSRFAGQQKASQSRRERKYLVNNYSKDVLILKGRRESEENIQMAVFVYINWGIGK
jgi:hypothetical protein